MLLVIMYTTIFCRLCVDGGSATVASCDSESSGTSKQSVSDRCATGDLRPGKRIW